MTIGQAVEVLNRMGHRCSGDWRTDSTEDGDALNIVTSYHGDQFTEFEAIAIAEAYEKAARNRADAVLKRPLD